MCDHEHNGDYNEQLNDAVRECKFDCVASLLEKGARATDETFDAFSSIFNRLTKLFEKDKSEWIAAFKTLVELRNSDLYLQRGYEFYRKTLNMFIVLSAWCGLTGCLRNLIDAGSDINTLLIGFTPLMASSEYGHLDCVEVLLAAGASVNIQNDKGTTALMCSAKSGWPDCLELLSQEGADVNLADSKGMTALMFATLSDRIKTYEQEKIEKGEKEEDCFHAGIPSLMGTDCVKMLLELDADVNKRSDDGITALAWAASAGHEKCMDLLLDAGAEVNALNYGITAIKMASQNGHLECVKKLIDAGADVNKVPQYGSPGENCCMTALMLAAEKGHHDCLVTLLLRGAGVNTMEDGGETALMYAAEGGHKDCVSTLLQWGAVVNVWDDKYEITALMKAAKNTTGKCADLLIQAGADVNRQDKNGKTALMYAAGAGNYECVDSLLQQGADIKEKTVNRLTAIDYAAMFGCYMSVEKLISVGADVTCGHNDNYTTLMFAAISGSDKCLERIIEAGADVNITNTYGYTALSFAAYERKARPEKVRCMELLVQAGANVNHCNSSGHSILHLAAISGFVEGTQFLIDKGADVNACDDNGNTVLMFAAGSGHDNYVEFITKDILRISSVEPEQHLPKSGTEMVGCLKLLLKSGAHVNKLNSFGENTLKYHEANCDHFDIKVAGLLAAAGDEPIGWYTQQFPLQRLTTICRRALRRHMSEANPVNLCCRVPQLELPVDLKDYVLYGHSLYD